MTKLYFLTAVKKIQVTNLAELSGRAVKISGLDKNTF